jgi:pilus assembly protein Flp/PilA
MQQNTLRRRGDRLRHRNAQDTTMHKLVNFLKDQSGASAAEYALILAVVGAGITGALTTLGTSIKNAVNSAATTINNGASAAH